MGLPKSGSTRAEVINSLRRAMKDDAPWDQGKTFFLVYGVDADHFDLLGDAYALFMATNGLGAGSMFPSLARLESDVIGATAELLGEPAAVGNITSGGTESILMGIRAAYERVRSERPGLRAPEIVLPESAHPAFQKAAQIFGLTSVRTPLDREYRADMKALRAAVNERTVAVVGSAPNYPFGTIDPIEEMAAVARERRIHFHVDACVGAFALPFIRRLGQPVPPYDFTVPGVSTISADIHKYGYGARGTSVIMYRDEEVRRFARFTLDDWSGGPYRTATLAGSRPGAIVASAWAALNYFGEEGYLKLTREMLDVVHAIRDGIAQAGFRVMGQPAMYVLAFTADDGRDMMAVGDAMAQRGWLLGRQPTHPPSLHLVLTPVHRGVVQAFLLDLKTVAGEATAPTRPFGKASGYANS
jgi:glutamate/tyrosine decarboxylase-like PLP-dependent enzyme